MWGTESHIKSTLTRWSKCRSIEKNTYHSCQKSTDNYYWIIISLADQVNIPWAVNIVIFMQGFPETWKLFQRYLQGKKKIGKAISEFTFFLRKAFHNLKLQKSSMLPFNSFIVLFLSDSSTHLNLSCIMWGIRLYFQKRSRLPYFTNRIISFVHWSAEPPLSYTWYLLIT